MKSAIFSGLVNHSRSTPVAHRFQFRLFMMYLDLGELDGLTEPRCFLGGKLPAKQTLVGLAKAYLQAGRRIVERAKHRPGEEEEDADRDDRQQKVHPA